MLTTMSLMVMLAQPAGETTLPRHADPPAAETPSAEVRRPTDPLYDKPITATDDAAFMLSAVENVRQGVIDARAGEAGLPTPELRSAAAKIGHQQQATLEKLESLAKAKGWRLPDGNPCAPARCRSVAPRAPARISSSIRLRITKP